MKPIVPNMYSKIPQQAEHGSVAGLIEAVFNQGKALANEDRFDEAVDAFNSVVDCIGTVTSAVVQRGRCHWEMRRWSSARKDFAFAATIDPLSADIQWTKALLDLQLHDFVNGWHGYESRWNSASFKSARLQTTRPVWYPGLECDHLVVWQEQGVGDQIIYSTFLPLLSSLVKRITVIIDARLVSLYQRSFPNIEFVGSTDRVRLGKNGAHIAIGSIAQHFIRRLSDIPKFVSTAYLKPDVERRDLFRKAAGITSKDFVVGISWASKAPVIGGHKSTALDDLLPLFEIPNVKVVNLQYSDMLPEIEAFEKKYGKKIITINSVNNFYDLDSVASIISMCDAVVSVSNATVHLAAAIGKPVFLLDANKLFFWNHKVGRQSLWYPSVSIYPRASVVDSWSLPISKAVEDLKKLLPGKDNSTKGKPPTFVFFHVGEDVSYPQKLVGSIRISNPSAEIVMCTDPGTPEVLGINFRVESVVDRRFLMTERLRLYAAAGLKRPAIYVDTDMLVVGEIRPEQMLGGKDLALCKRSFGIDAEFNTEQRNLSFPEYAGKTLMEVYPYIACTIVAKDHTIFESLYETLVKMDPKYHVWYGDQEALKMAADKMRDRVTTFPESEYGCLPEETVEVPPKIIHFKGPSRKHLFEDV